MRRYFLFIAGVIILLSTSNGTAQYKAPTLAEMKRLLHNMTDDSTDTWLHSAFDYGQQKYGPKFDVWIKSHPIDNLRYFLSYSVKGEILSAQLYNAAQIELASTSITKDNASNYQYRVVTNDSVELVPWTTPSVFRSNKFTSYAYLGKFDCRRKTITLTIAEKNNRANQSVYIYNSDDLAPVTINNLFVEYPTGLSAKNASDRNKGFGIHASKNPQRINLDIENTSQNELYHVYVNREFNGENSTLLVGNNWEHDFNSPNPIMHISSSFFNKPGKYTIIIRPEMAAGYNKSIIIGSEVKVHFTVFPAPITFSLKTVELFIVVLLMVLGILFIIYRSRQKKKLAREARDKQIATLQLQSVRAQLNPHFIFNALAGIQNLINKNAIEDANRYLTRFARLTRNVLDDGDKELISIEQELNLLDDYLKMEQTRFGFKFDINIGEIDQQIEIPAMLLQPFIENAVKHGVSALKSAGQITVTINKQHNTLVLSVQDNGKGFDTAKKGGMGMKLCHDRIALFNSIYKNTLILLQIKADSAGTLVTIELKNWL